MGKCSFKTLFVLTCFALLQSCTNAIPKLSGLNVDISSTAEPVQVLKVEANPVSGAYNLNQIVEIKVVFSDTVSAQYATNNISTFPPKLKLETGSVDHEATYYSGNGTNTLIFRYTVVAGDSSSDLNYVSTDSLDLNTSSLVGSKGQSVIKDLPALNSTSSLAGTSAISITGTAGHFLITAGATFSDTVLNFSSIQTVTIKNISANNINISALSLSSTTNFNFVGAAYPGGSFAQACPTLPSAFVAGATCKLQIEFNPKSVSASLLAQLNIAFTDGSNAITNSLTISGAGLASFPLTVADNYDVSSTWNKYIKSDGTQVYNATATACNGSESGDYFTGCIHAAEIKRVEVPVISSMSCSTLTITDNLNLFNWICNDADSGTSGVITFYSKSLKTDKGLKNLIQASGASGAWIPNFTQIHVTSGGVNVGALYGASTAAAWWSNSILQLPVNASPASLLLSDTNHPIYVINADQDTEGGYQIGASGISFVTLGISKINQTGSSFTANCRNDGGSTTSGLDMRGIFCGYQKKFLWFEVNLDGKYGTVANYAGAGIVLNGTKLTRIQSSTFKNFNSSGSYSAIRLLNSNKNLNSHIDIFNVNSAISLDNSSFNFIKFLRMAKIQFAGGTASAVFLNSANSNKLTDIQLSGMVTTSAAFGIYSNFSDGNIFQRVSISNIDAQASLGYATGIALSDVTNSVLSQITIFGVEGNGITLDGVSSTSSNYLSHLTLINNTDFGLQLWGDNVSDNFFNSTVVGNNDDNILIFGDVVTPTASLNNIFYNTVSTNSVNSTGSVYIDRNYEAAFNGYMVSTYGEANACLIGTTGVTTNLNAACRGTPETASGSALGSFVTKVTSDDATNTVDSNGTSAFTALTSIAEWLDFNFGFRGWSRSTGTFPSVSNQGPCDGSFACRIWDWRLKPSTSLYNSSFSYFSQNPAISFSGGNCTSSLSGNDVVTVNGKTFLKYAIEIDGDDVGNDNGLCQSGDHCVYALNVGSYQGEGEINKTNYCTTPSSGVTVTNAKIFKYTDTSAPSW
ncbi:MAG: hypothetical protein AABY64_04780 [Bdellovibrionota bacterium]